MGLHIAAHVRFAAARSFLSRGKPETRTTRLAARSGRLHRPGDPRGGPRDADVTGRAIAHRASDCCFALGTNGRTPRTQAVPWHDRFHHSGGVVPAMAMPRSGSSRPSQPRDRVRRGPPHSRRVRRQTPAALHRRAPFARVLVSLAIGERNDHAGLAAARVWAGRDRPYRADRGRRRRPGRLRRALATPPPAVRENLRILTSRIFRPTRCRPIKELSGWAENGVLLPCIISRRLKPRPC